MRRFHHRSVPERGDQRAGVMGHGLFLGLVETLIVASPQGVVTRTRSPASSLGAPKPL